MKKTAIYQKKRRHASRWSNKWIQSPGGLIAFGFTVVVCLVLFVVNAVLDRIHPGTIWGISYGIAATVLLVCVFLWMVRRRSLCLYALSRAWPFLQIHVYGGVLFLLLVLMHTGFKLPHGVLNIWLWSMSIWVVLSGLLGIALQKWIPTLLTSGLSIEVHYDRIPELITEARQKAERLIQTCELPVQDFYRTKLAPILAKPQPRLIFFLDITAGQTAKFKQFDTLRILLPDGEKQKLDHLLDICKTKLEMDAHCSLQRALRWWLYLHVPCSILLFVLTIIHVFVVFYY